ncbi:RNA-directed DNA polymerase, eukaryota, reverse transcriptase zinc-binding domain protein [Tanacetum coccineum]
MRIHISNTTSLFPEVPYRWNNILPSKVNISSWRIFHRRLPTRLNLDKRGIDLDSVLCPICNDNPELEDHIFVECCIAKSTWFEFQGSGAVAMDGDGRRRWRPLVIDLNDLPPVDDDDVVHLFSAGIEALKSLKQMIQLLIVAESVERVYCIPVTEYSWFRPRRQRSRRLQIETQEPVIVGEQGASFSLTDSIAPPPPPPPSSPSFNCPICFEPILPPPPPHISVFTVGALFAADYLTVSLTTLSLVYDAKLNCFYDQKEQGLHADRPMLDKSLTKPGSNRLAMEQTWLAMVMASAER